MTYQTRIDEMVGRHVAEFQHELTSAGELKAIDSTHTLPYGYAPGIYRPLHICRMPAVKRYIARTGGCMSNGVPRVLRTEFVGGYPLGVYNHPSARMESGCQ